jgi:excinuclease ABC subunit C
VLVPTVPEDAEVYEEWLGEMRGTKVAIRVPQRGAKRELAETVTRNAEETFTRHRLKRAADHNSRAKALNDLQEALGLPEAPLRIECYDMSHLQGSDYVGSMVVMEDGLPRKGEYRRFKVREVPGNDDFAAMEEVLTRRLRNFLEEQELPPGERGRFAYPPQLLLVDGGKGQLGVAVKVLAELGLTEKIPVASLAKRFEEVYLPGRSEPVELPRGSEGLFMLQRLRDESHRFAISYHRQLRDKRMTRSVLDGIPGLGDTRRTKLVQQFGGVRAVQRASLEDLLEVTWLPEAVAHTVYEHLHPEAARSAAPDDGQSSDGGVGSDDG